MVDVAKIWTIPYTDAVHVVRFEYEPLSERRIVYLDNIIIRNSIFKFIEEDVFYINKIKACLTVKPHGRLGYEFTLTLAGQPFERFVANWRAVTKCWVTHIDGHLTRIVLEKDTMDVWVNGEVLETAGEFADEGTETHFSIRGHACYIKAVSSGKRREGIIHTLFVEGQELPESME